VNQAKYIGMDVHQATISVAVMDSAYLTLRYVVRNGFINIYPDQTVPVQLQNLVSGYPTHQDLARDVI
jgi:hypothetical protein